MTLFRTVFLLAVLFPVSALADCPIVTALSCTLDNGAEVELCADAEALRLRVRTPGSAAFERKNPVAAPGVTQYQRAASVEFTDGDLVWEVYEGHWFEPRATGDEIIVHAYAGLLTRRGADIVDDWQCLPNGYVHGGLETLTLFLRDKGLCRDEATGAFEACQ